jgi:hypothetical protein
MDERLIIMLDLTMVISGEEKQALEQVNEAVAT